MQPRLSWHDQQPSPKHGDVIACGQLKIKVGSHNGDFREILVEDHLGNVAVCDGPTPGDDDADE